MSSLRKLTTILVADIAGYSRMMGADEFATLRALGECRRLIDPLFARHQGRIFGAAGDSVLAEFPSAVGAVAAAVDMQLVLRLHQSDRPENRRLHYRVGIAIGDVAVDGDNLLGDGVNIAARLQSLAELDGVVVSADVRNQVDRKLAVAFDDLGEQTVKNIDRPLHVYRAVFTPKAMSGLAFSAEDPVNALPAATVARSRVAWTVGAVVAVILAAVTGVALWPRPGAVPQAPATATAPTATAAAPPERAALIVLPFANISDDPSQEYFSDGFTEDLTTALARVPGLLVMARNTAFTYKGKAVDATQVGRELGVRYVLEGSVRKAGDRLRMNAQLIEAATGNHVWAEKYDRVYAEVFTVQDELADRIVGSVTSQLRRREGERALAASPDKLEAYELTMRARRVISQGGRDSTFEARRLAQQAIEKDSSFAPAYVRYAQAMNLIYVNRWNEEFGLPATAERMAAAAAKAVSLAPDDALARVINGFSLTVMQQFDAAAGEADRALALAPDDADVLGQIGTLLNRVGRYERTVEVVRKAERLDPFLYAGVGNIIGVALYLLDRYAEATEVTRSCVQRVPSNVLCWTYLIAALGQMKPASEIRTEVAELLKISPGFTVTADKARRLTTFRNAHDVELIAQGLRKAGVPE